MSELSRILKSINLKTELLDKEFIEEHYVPFVVNRVFSYFLDTCLFAWELDRKPNIDKYSQYLYYYYNIRKANRFAKWHKPANDKYIQAVKEYYGYSTRKAQDAVSLLTDEQLNEIQHKLDKGGRR